MGKTNKDWQYGDPAPRDYRDLARVIKQRERKPRLTMEDAHENLKAELKKFRESK